MKYILATTLKPLSDYTWRDFSIRKVNAKQAAFITFVSHQDAEAFGSRHGSNAIAVRFSDEELEILKLRFRNDHIDFIFELDGRHFETVEEMNKYKA